MLMALVLILTSCNAEKKDTVNTSNTQQNTADNAKSNGQDLNQFFFNDAKSQKQYIYKGTAWGDIIIKSDKSEPKDSEGNISIVAKLTVNEIAQLSNGKVYELEFSLYGTKNNSKERIEQSYLWVTKDKIYEFYPPDGFDYKGYSLSKQSNNSDYAKVLEKLGQLPKNSQDLLRCNNDNMNFSEGLWKTEISVENDICTYLSYHTGSSHFKKFVWEKGKGLTQYAWGYGAHRDGMDLKLDQSSQSTTQNSQQQNMFQKDSYDYSGEINQNLKIRMSLYPHGNSLDGTYFYETIKKEIKVQGKVASNQILLDEFDESGNITGTFKGVIKTVDGFDGIWTSPDGKKTYPFKVSLVDKTVNFSTFDINKKYYNDAKGFVELKLKLPRLDGNCDGIPEINKYFADKEKFFYNELPLDSLKEANIKVEGMKDNWYRSADYKLEAVLGDIISVSADLNGGAGGVGWAGIEGDTFDLNTGKKLSLSDIFKVNKDEYMKSIYDFVSKKIMNEINKNLQAEYGSGYDFDDAYSGDGYKSIRDFDPNNFYLTKNALVVFYPKYALACGAAGPQKFEIPFDSIVDVLALNVKQEN